MNLKIYIDFVKRQKNNWIIWKAGFKRPKSWVKVNKPTSDLQLRARQVYEECIGNGRLHIREYEKFYQIHIDTYKPKGLLGHLGHIILDFPEFRNTIVNYWLIRTLHIQ